MANLNIVVKPRWWLPIYINTLAFLCAVMRAEPDTEKVGKFIARYGLKIYIDSKVNKPYSSSTPTTHEGK